ncbi:ubiquitin carboxyl-terminal hydrolase 17-like [Dorcoceras hygrometricum]|uniref:Ubiquitin carboxyl-terminal hydrolase 17-like n=1 Tax=Dorcoceras hygrometricum TaxID=472368 RepID=A0A2Z7CN42_9LAMI|nr:ubiquitin carboxyl-terminal hydrolase 17-like [Dorcoceras hygrometricum]
MPTSHSSKSDSLSDSENTSKHEEVSEFDEIEGLLDSEVETFENLIDEETIGHNHPSKELRHVNQQCGIANVDALWYGHLSSKLKPNSEQEIRSLTLGSFPRRSTLPTCQRRPLFPFTRSPS